MTPTVALFILVGAFILVFYVGYLVGWRAGSRWTQMWSRISEVVRNP